MAKAAPIPSLYALKALMAFFVVLTHVSSHYGEYIRPLMCIAVPCFFCITGFFLYSGDADEECRKAWRWIKNAIFLTIWLNLFYYFTKGYISGCGFKGTSRGWCILLLQGGNVAPHLWYMTALWQTLIAFVIARKFFSERLVFLAPFLIVFSLITGRYSHYILDGKFSSSWAELSFLFVGIPCMSAGYLIAKYKKTLLQCTHWGFLFLLGCVLSYVEYVVLEGAGRGGYFLFTLPVSVCLILMCLETKWVPWKWLEHIGCRHSANIYYYHMIFVSEGVYALFGGWLMAPCVFVLSVLLSCVICSVKGFLRRRVRYS